MALRSKCCSVHRMPRKHMTTKAITTQVARPQPSAPCPACQKRWVYRRDSSGENVRQPALQLTAQGCSCQACRYTWDPSYFVHLARVLECPLPEGVLE
ncbi:DUF7340 domain-containing protein [Mycobacteroides abscessus]|uniref:DUF7340 domain-containing protein n=1 Tax=Mycobacteroides abscessus TaxID=36809 RepID=UPI003C75AE38